MVAVRTPNSPTSSSEPSAVSTTVEMPRRPACWWKSNVRPPSVGDQNRSAETDDDDGSVGQADAVGEHGHGAGLDLLPGLAGILGPEEVAAEAEEEHGVALERKNAEERTLVGRGQLDPGLAVVVGAVGDTRLGGDVERAARPPGRSRGGASRLSPRGSKSQVSPPSDVR